MKVISDWSRYRPIFKTEISVFYRKWKNSIRKILSSCVKNPRGRHTASWRSFNVRTLQLFRCPTVAALLLVLDGGFTLKDIGRWQKLVFQFAAFAFRSNLEWPAAGHSFQLFSLPLTRIDNLILKKTSELRCYCPFSSLGRETPLTWFCSNQSDWSTWL